MDKLYESEKQAFLEEYQCKYRGLNIFLILATVLLAGYCTIGAIAMISDGIASVETVQHMPGSGLTGIGRITFVPAFDWFSLIFALLTGSLLTYGINAFRTRIVMYPVSAIKSDDYTVFREIVTDKDTQRAGENRKRKAYFVSTRLHTNVPAVSGRNWNAIALGDVVCIIETRRMCYAMKF
ncbi:MAG: hypothetical protein IJ496_06555 [Ruminococcus sp.]|nr:hypothetical protein [Ruminococcus sp.]